jgi:hypothetical protein
VTHLHKNLCFLVQDIVNYFLKILRGQEEILLLRFNEDIMDLKLWILRSDADRYF